MLRHLRRDLPRQCGSQGFQHWFLVPGLRRIQSGAEGIAWLVQSTKDSVSGRQSALFSDERRAVYGSPKKAEEISGTPYRSHSTALKFGTSGRPAVRKIPGIPLGTPDSPCVWFRPARSILSGQSAEFQPAPAACIHVLLRLRGDFPVPYLE